MDSLLNVEGNSMVIIYLLKQKLNKHENSFEAAEQSPYFCLNSFPFRFNIRSFVRGKSIKGGYWGEALKKQQQKLGKNERLVSVLTHYIYICLLSSPYIPIPLCSVSASGIHTCMKWISIWNDFPLSTQRTIQHPILPLLTHPSSSSSSLHHHHTSLAITTIMSFLSHFSTYSLY